MYLLWLSCCPSSRLFLFCLLRSRCFSSLGASSGRFWVSKMTLRPSKIELPHKRGLDFWKIDVFDSKVVLRASWGSLGPLLGALGGLLGASWAPLGCSWGSLGGFSGAKEPSWAPLGCSCCPSSRLFSFDLLRTLFLFFSWGFLWSILGLEDDPPPLKIRAPA